VSNGDEGDEADAADDKDGEGATRDATTAREEVIGELREVREQARYKAIGDGRIRDPEREKVRIKYLRTIVYAANTERSLLKDRDLDAMLNELEDLLDHD
jgi:hypothetical protein